ncbi:alpha-glucosidase [Marchantia polymorpha subsp. ruderalis]|uniref:alpha-glucosidase n=2 Tax=Marchantia polymorpha TaxID=3197 RepID=A0A176VWP6_MARPO|nr:hypothetical protein AXG93_2210s1040 [Marchantia polymorpha subsp. ruderalis]PTQ47447.1 hypothetical protein MARPO_0008s0198 [Marchantia polymorpha]BBN19385.1 hypothetical protein Mp_8g10240 [Marchantia polymorpha subsp. ruderalis]|eukprot:PTQ47447.1 hypothetical protein MARPO_0008s0198 [Marchantia polymorpha]
MGTTGIHSLALALLCCTCLLSTTYGDYSGGYKLVSLSNYSDGKGLVAYLKSIDDGNFTYGPPVEELQLTVRFETDDRLRVKITDGKKDRWEIPEWIVPRGAKSSEVASLTSSEPEKQGEVSVGDSSFKFSYTSEPFGFAVSRSSGEVLFNTTPNGDIGSLVFKDQYLEITTHLPEKSVLFGLGESTRPDGLRLAPGRVYTLWATDIGSNIPDIDLYGTYPFYMDLRKGVAHGVLLLNSNGMDVLYERDSLTYRVIGGILDFYFFAGPTPLSVVDQYTQLVGRPAAMPYWSLGFHQSRYGYKNLEELEEVVAKYAAAEIPLETMWSDIDYMDEYKDFTTHPVNYPEDKLRTFVEKLHANDMRYVIIVDPGIAIAENYSTYQRGLDLDVYVRNQYGEKYLAQVWPGPVYFPDFLHPNAEEFWTTEVVKFHKKIPFDGLWIDMNEAANFCTGPSCFINPDVVCPGDDYTICCLICNNTVPMSTWDDPPYKINCIGKYRELNGRTIAMSAQHHGGVREYDTHNLFGLTESIMTNRALKTLTKKRPFVLSRSTFVGSGAYTAHWTGDNGASFNDLAYSIVSCLNSGMFGVPMVGADICGFLDDTWEELCNRWIQVGAFYPFARDHGDFHSIHQELYLWDSVASNAKVVLNLRYKLLPYYYTLIFESHNTGAPIMRPLFFEYPEDEKTMDINTQFLVGRGIMVSPVVAAGQDTIAAYFPPGVWYNAFNNSDIVKVEGSGELLVLPAPLDTIQVHYRQGFIIPMQEAAMTTTSARRTPFTLMVVFGDEDEAEAAGELFLDDGEELEMRVKAGRSTFVKFSAHKFQGKGSIEAKVTAGEFALSQHFVLHKITILGLREPPSRVRLTGNLAPVMSPALEISSSGLRSVDISHLNLSLSESFGLSWDFDFDSIASS